jgi:copper chaperone NosL
VNSRALLLLLGALVACGGGPPAIAYDSDNCDFCRMTISDRRFATAATTATGRTVHFDAVECLAGWVAAQDEAPRAVWVTDASHPGTLIPVADAEFYRASAGRSPMGNGYVALARSADRSAAGLEAAEGPFTWQQVREAVAREGLGPAPAVVGMR